ncbi:MAG TPA: hypothetical protein VFX66_00480 [Sulfuricurvum sp.]|nr:hypothetical protein [Sulfuricurvum sp.]
MNKVLLVCFLFFSLQGAPWRESKSFTLAKDQLVKILVKSEGQERMLSWRWTLYTDKGLVVHENFDRFVGQHVLYSGYSNQSFRKQLLPANKSERDAAYVIVVFKKFDEGANKAQFDLLLFDREKRVVLDYLTEK